MCMRTTLNIDDDVLMAVKERSRRSRRSAGEILSELARQALSASSAPSGEKRRTFHGFDPVPSRGVTISNALVDRLREEEPE